MTNINLKNITENKITDHTGNDGAWCDHLSHYEVYNTEYLMISGNALISQVHDCRCTRCGYLFEVQTTYQAIGRTIQDADIWEEETTEIDENESWQ